MELLSCDFEYPELNDDYYHGQSKAVIKNAQKEAKEWLEENHGKKADIIEPAPQYHDDDENEVNPSFVPKPSLCISCKKDELGPEEVLCDLTRMDHLGKDEFICEAYEPKDQE